MKIAHLILAHNNPQQLEHLIDSLTYAEDSIFVHLDEKADIEPFQHLKQRSNVTFIHQRVKVKWGAYSIVQATINSFEQMVKQAGDHDFVNLLSGADYPLQRPQDIHAFLELNKGKIFMSYMPILEEWTDAVSRIVHYHFNEYAFPGVYKLQGLVNKIMPKRKLPDGMVGVGHSQWFTTSMESVGYMVKYWNEHANFRRFIKLTWGPDEFVFQTMLFNSPLRAQMVNDNLRYIDWSAGGASPKTFQAEDIPALLASNKLYARKFDLQDHGEVIAAVNKKLAADDQPRTELISA